MKLNFFLCFVPFLLLLGCGQPPSGGGGRPEGDFPVNVVGSPAVVTNLQASVRLVGGLVPVDEIQVVARLSAEVVDLPFSQGALVAQGDLLVGLDDARLRARKAELEARMTLAESTHRRNVRLQESDSATDQEVETSAATLAQSRANLALLEEELRDTRLHAPFAGRLGERRVSVGQLVQPGEVLTRLVRLDPLEARFEVPERLLSVLDEGLKVSLRSDAFPDTPFEGEVVFVSPEVDTVTRTVAVRARVENPEAKLRPGMFVRVDLVLEERADTLVVPETAVMQRGRESQVFVRDEDGRAELRTVHVGIRLEGWVEIREGLSEGDVVVVEGQMKARPGLLLSFTERSTRYGLDLEAVALPDGEVEADGSDADPPPPEGVADEPVAGA